MTLFETIMDSNQEMVYRYALKACRNQDEAEDITQEVFTKAFESLSQFKGRAKFSTWLYSITRNEIHRRSKINANPEPEQEKHLIQDYCKRFQQQITPEVALLKEEMNNRLRTVMANLPLDYKKPLILYYFENKSYKEIAENMNLKMNTLKSYIFRGKQILKDWLKKDYE